MNKKGLLIFTLCVITWQLKAQWPDTPILDSVSIINNQTVIGWRPNTTNTEGYIIYHLNNNNARIPIDTVWGMSSSSYTDTQFSPCNKAQSYCINAINKDMVSQLGTNDDRIHRTLFVKELNPNACADSTILSWTPYINMPDNISGYQIFISTDNINFTYSGTTAANQTTFIQKELDQNINYYFKVRAFNNYTSSTSCSIMIYKARPPIPQVQQLDVVSVTDNNSVFLQFRTDIQAADSHYILWRKRDQNNNYQPIDTIKLTNQYIITYTNHNLNTQQYSYRYMITSTDSCLASSSLPETSANTILLSAKTSARINHLSWTPYQGTHGTCLYYILTQNSDSPTPAKIKLPPSIQTYDDAVGEYYNSSGFFSYKITAVIQPTDVLGGDTLYSHSNTINVNQLTDVFIPSAFTPDNDGHNDIFKPINIYSQDEEYSFKIFDRWGKLIYQTNNKTNGWDGMDGTKVSPQGTYVYILQIKSTTGRLIEKKGSFTLLRK